MTDKTLWYQQIIPIYWNLNPFFYQPYQRKSAFHSYCFLIELYDSR
jgi:hypothetical protein